MDERKALAKRGRSRAKYLRGPLDRGNARGDRGFGRESAARPRSSHKRTKLGSARRSRPRWDERPPRSLRHREQLAERTAVVIVVGVMPCTDIQRAVSNGKIRRRRRPMMVIVLAPQHLVQAGSHHGNTRIPAQKRECGDSPVHDTDVAKEAIAIRLQM